MKESWLFKIIYTLLQKDRVTAPELAKKFEVSVRTIYRDIDVISSAGIPIYVTAGRNGGIHLLNNYVLEKAVFSDQEKQALLAALQSVSVIGNVCETELLTKLSALFHLNTEQWFEADFSRWGHGVHDTAVFTLLKEAVINHKAVEIEYVGVSGKKTHRKIQPLGLFYKAHAWYLKSFCTQAHDFRFFKLNRMLTCKPLDEAFVPQPFPDIQHTEEHAYNKIVLRFSPKAAHRLYDEFTDDEITEQENGDLVATAFMPEDSWLIGYLLSFGAEVEVLEPASLCAILCRQAQKIYEKNKP